MTAFRRRQKRVLRKRPQRVTFSPVIQSTAGEMDLPTADQDDTPADSPMTTIIEEKERPKAQETKEESIVPPPGFRPFQWPQADWDDIGDDIGHGTRFCGDLVSTNNGREVVSTASHTALTDHSGGLPGFYCGASGFSRHQNYTHRQD